ncbi:MAG: DUF1416 domain-containing protein [Candidatus Levybacteria bacterium]|nr:DUF1416 domain-containing protein [Candidatus Levybacteria bacterium]
MRILGRIFELLAVVFLFGFVFNNSVIAATLTGTITDSSNNPVTGGFVRLLVPGTITDTFISEAQISSEGTYSVQADDGTYDIYIQSIEPPYPDYKALIVTNQNLSGAVARDFVVTADQHFTVSGHITDRNGDPIPEAVIYTPQGDIFASADGNGFYSASLQAGQYYLFYFSGGISSFVPQSYVFSMNKYYVATRDFNLDVQISPIRRITLHVLDGNNNPINNARLEAIPFFSFSNSQGIFVANLSRTGIGTTDENGDVSFSAFPNHYQVLVNPPSDSGISPFSSFIDVGDIDEAFTIRGNTPPVISPIPNVTLNEGSTYSYIGSFNDSDSSAWNASVDYGDGSGSQPLNLNGTSFSLNNIYANPGVYTVTVTVMDDQGAAGTGTATITVNNVAPTVEAISAPTAPVQINTAVTASASFSDPGVSETHTASWDWGDGVTTSGTITESNGSGSVSGNHTYTATGVYTVVLSVTDNYGGVGSSQFQYIAVYAPNPSALFSGSRMFNSPAGAYPQNPQLTGKVMFGISVKYSNDVPTGNTDMDFKVGNLNFVATSYQYLVTTGAKATLKGSGTINGSGNYTFLATGIQGSNGGQDFIRFQIKDSSNTVIYDTQPGAADTSDPITPVTGHIVVH